MTGPTNKLHFDTKFKKFNPEKYRQLTEQKKKQRQEDRKNRTDSMVEMQDVDESSRVDADDNNDAADNGDEAAGGYAPPVLTADAKRMSEVQSAFGFGK